MRESPCIIGVLASGRGTNLQAILDAIKTGVLAARVGVVISDKKEATALERAREHSVTAVFIDPRAYPDRVAYDTAVVNALAEQKVEFVVLAGYMRLVSKAILEAFPNRVINVHPSLLPAFPGLHAHRQVLAYGAKVSGCTIHFVDEKVDHGPIIAQVSVPVLEGDTEESLSDRVLIEEHRLLPRIIQCYVEGKLTLDDRRVVIEGGI